jgi:uracil phosphoribosyltransferase
MSIISLDLEKNSETESLISVCRSESQICGYKLREAHYKLGNVLARRVASDLPNHDITIIIMMRAGLCFGMGIADALDVLGLKVSILFYFNDEQWNKEKVKWAQALTNDIILADAVINTGNSIIELAQTLQNSRNVFFTSNVLSEKAVHKFNDKCLYTIRISEKSFVGSKVSIIKDGKGPDTGDRLFTQYEFVIKQ